MSIEVMKRALEALENHTPVGAGTEIKALRTAIQQAEAKQPATAIACGIPEMAKTTCPYCEQGFAFEFKQAESEPCKSFTELRDRHREGVDAELAAMAAEAKPPSTDPMLATGIKPRPLSYPLDAYHRAPCDGPLNATWQDKPHRLLYDLIAAVAYYAQDGSRIHPAPEGLQWFTVDEHGLPEVGEAVIGGLWYTDPWLKSDRATYFMWGQCSVIAEKHHDFKEGKRWLTFGPSHNQITHWARLTPPPC